MRKAITGLLIALPLAVGTLLVSPSSASASLSQCDSGYFCAWTEDNFSGKFKQWWNSDSDWTNDGMHDDADSVFNNAKSSTTVPDNVQVFKDVGYGQLSICVLPGETYDAGMNDNAYDSHKWVHSC